MARLNERRCYWVFTDSRGVGLQEKVDVLNSGEYLGVRVCKGAMLHQLSRMAGAHLEKYPFDVVYVAGGVCDITTKCQITKSISFNWDPPTGVGAHLIRSLRLENKYLLDNHPASKVVFCPLVGVDLIKVVTNKLITGVQQSAADEAVFEFNNEIFNLNKEKGTFSSALHRTIHRSKGSVRKSHYQHLDDGLHPTENLLEKWAHEFVKATGNN